VDVGQHDRFDAHHVNLVLFDPLVRRGQRRIERLVLGGREKAPLFGLFRDEVLVAEHVTGHLSLVIC
jgi:hypothetical protein